ncbi:hypothetical protein OF83DRAFT_1066716 [Amylostereum chailletii]|nr:hypothetical protein OF83DRAFT_1066716 [Amylostereum chailletii]
MHPQSSEKRIACRDFFDALEACHASPWKKFTGGCNEIKRDLNGCLHGETMARSARNREDAKLRRERMNQAVRELHKDD